MRQSSSGLPCSIAIQVDTVSYLNTFLSVLRHPKPGALDTLSIVYRRSKYPQPGDKLQFGGINILSTNKKKCQQYVLSSVKGYKEVLKETTHARLPKAFRPFGALPLCITEA